LGFLHFSKNILAKFIRLQIELIEEKSIKFIELTPAHLIYSVDCLRYRMASELQLNDFVYCINSKGVMEKGKIFKIDMINKRGFYAPLTASGDLMVNDVLVSCYSLAEI